MSQEQKKEFFDEVMVYSAYCHLVAAFWGDMVREGAQPKDYVSLIEELKVKIAGNTNTCSAYEAIQWLRVFKKPPFSQIIRYEEIVIGFTERIKKTICSPSKNQAQETNSWMLFIEESGSFAWALDCLSVVCSGSIPAYAARNAFEVLKKMAPGDASWRSVCSALVSIALPKGKDIWSIESFREALWAIMRQNQQQLMISRCMNDLFPHIKNDVSLFKGWVDACNKLASDNFLLWEETDSDAIMSGEGVIIK